ncbi:MAG: FG-GAP-like repeat-containing protein [Myxococcales bacterium]|nr:FG-GAP-like repeat-containing protein [Myxococcales bacterium]
MNKRLVLTLAIISYLGISFWAGSRYPSLNEKATMGGETRFEDPLGFDVIVPLAPSDVLPVRVLKTTANWAYTNKRGMTFGVLFGAALMGVFSLLRKRSYKSSIANSALGIAVGAPLGVCVNCATPIAQGIHSAGARLETTLATMLSSPTLNIIVVTMLFALFPPYLIAIKLGLTLAFILVGIPILAHYIARHHGAELAEDLTISDEACPIDLMEPDAPSGESWIQAGIWTVKSFVSNLWWIFRRTVPLMLVAGFLGALVITVLPWDTLAGLFEGRGGRLYDIFGDFGVALMGILVVCGVGIFLPVPIAFDVIIVAILLGAGMPVHYAMGLLFTLGIFSVYSFSVVWRDISKQVAVAVTASCAILGVVGSLMAMGYHRWDTDRKTELFFQTFNETESGAPAPIAALEARAGIGVAELALARAELAPVEDLDLGLGLRIERTPFHAREGSETLKFTKASGADYGLDEPYEFSITRFNRPYEYHRGIAAGDVHNDGWTDIVVASDNHVVSLYANVGGKFALQKLELPSLQGNFVSLVALADLDDDGWLDLLVSTYLRGSWVVYNSGGHFDAERLVKLPDGDTVMTAAATFGDLDRDGDLDVVLGNWSRWQRHERSQNALLLRGDDGFELRPLEGEMVGETLSALLTDLDGDDDLDLVLGNDFDQPDAIYHGDGAGGLTPIGADVIPHTTETTMSITSADLDNDLTPELYLAQVTGRSTQTDPVRSVDPAGVCVAHEGGARERCLAEADIFELVRRSRASRDALRCKTIGDARLVEECIAHHLMANARWERDESLCDYFPERWADLAKQCHMSFVERIEYPQERYDSSIPQIRNLNVLLYAGDDGAYRDRAMEVGLGVTGWTWNAKFADLDNDEYLDLYAVNGLYESKVRESSYLYRNNAGKGFEDVTIEAGVEDFYSTSAYSYLDLDNDGDLDIVAVPINGPLWVYENESTTGNPIEFELRDFAGNRQGIGSKIIVHYGPGEKRHQMRELQSGGGFISFDPTIAHFGLGEHERVARVEIHWSTGEKSELEGPFATGARYRVTRPATGALHAAKGEPAL